MLGARDCPAARGPAAYIRAEKPVTRAGWTHLLRVSLRRASVSVTLVVKMKVGAGPRPETLDEAAAAGTCLPAHLRARGPEHSLDLGTDRGPREAPRPARHAATEREVAGGTRARPDTEKLLPSARHGVGAGEGLLGKPDSEKSDLPVEGDSGTPERQVPLSAHSNTQRPRKTAHALMPPELRLSIAQLRCERLDVSRHFYSLFSRRSGKPGASLRRLLLGENHCSALCSPVPSFSGSPAEACVPRALCSKVWVARVSSIFLRLGDTWEGVPG